MKPALPPSRRTVDMVEDGRVVVRHVFFGRDEAEAKHMEEAHREADKSLDASMSGEPYEGTDIKAVRPGIKESRSIIEHGSRIWDKLRERNAREVGWTPEARAAALVARQHGYKATGGGGPAALTMRHPEGHRVTIAPSGEWGHSGAEKGGQKGYGEHSLYQHLTSVHGAPKQEAEVKDAGGHGSDAHSASVAIRREHARRAGATYNGIQPMVGEPDHHMFTDLKYGSSFTVPVTKATAGAVKAAADAKRAQGGQLSTPEERQGLIDLENRKFGPRKKAVAEAGEAQEVGWTDEARMAAAIARRAGYERHGSGQFGDHYIHPGDRHALRIDPNGRWEHVKAPLHKGWSTKGEGAEALAKHLAGVHHLQARRGRQIRSRGEGREGPRVGEAVGVRAGEPRGAVAGPRGDAGPAGRAHPGDEGPRGPGRRDTEGHGLQEVRSAEGSPGRAGCPVKRRRAMITILKLVVLVVDNAAAICLGIYLGHRFQKQIEKLYTVAEDVVGYVYGKIRG